MNSMLRDVVSRGTGRRALQLGRSDLGGKTGTTNEAADTWFNGFNPDVVTSVWVGFPGHSPLGSREYGSNNPLPIWIDYMRVALADRPERLPAQPPGVVTVRVPDGTGAQSGSFEYYLEEYAPATRPDSDSRTQDLSRDDLRPVDIF
jgi:penicillin-binding protein 1A